MALNTRTGLLIHEAETKNILWANPAACRMFGWTLDELKPLKAHHMSAQERKYRREVGVAWLQAAVENGTSRKQWKYRAKDGTEFLTDAIATLVQSVDGPVVMVEFRDIGEEIELQEELHRVSESLQRIMTHTAAGVVVLTEDNLIDDISPLAASLFGRTAEELMGRPLDEFCTSEPPLRAPAVVETLTTANGSASVQLEVTDDARTTWLAGEIETVAHDGIRTRVLTVRDVTERVEWQQRSDYQQANLQYLSRYHAMGDMAMILAHQLGQPLAASTNYLSGLKARLGRDDFDPRSLTYGIDQIEAQLHRAADIVASVKKYVRRIESTAALMDLNASTAEALYFVRLRAAEKGVRVFADLPERNLYIRGESVMVGQVIINACMNALDEIAQPTTLVKELALTTGEADGFAFVTVQDQGRGIGETSVPGLIDGAFTTKVDGSGIGLLISQHIVERHGGTIEFLPNDPQGTIVKISIPLADAAVGVSATAGSRTGG
ncbi:PAS domain-containing sensor histidine kinase [Gordonia phthalatica]|uniref:histidine kinase n=1 Tax=Gordonia phthalatica TaxID=1136941 RepID=A0A0N9NHW4_9ACTN|nr:PAS domain-containing sensor histidine kinase [Gordonia phthalatica]ALG86809.1 histidine kinase [Gordonia phthalatica]